MDEVSRELSSVTCVCACVRVCHLVCCLSSVWGLIWVGLLLAWWNDMKCGSEWFWVSSK